MKQKAGLYIRVSEEWLERVRVEAGACGEGVSEYVRGAVEMRMERGPLWSDGRAGSVVAYVPAKDGDAARIERVDAGGISGLSGSAATPAVAVAAAPSAVRVTIDPADDAGVGKASDKWAAAVAANEAKLSQKKEVAVVRSKVFTQTPEERAEKLKMLQGMKLMPQMQPKTEFYPDEEPNEENT